MLRYVLAATLAALPLATPAWASDAQSRAVHTGDLDLTSVDGKAALTQRVERAARRVCPVAGPSAREYSAMRACQRAALDGSAPSMARAEQLQGERRVILAASQSAEVSARAAAR